jgi:hypothetical protein
LGFEATVGINVIVQSESGETLQSCLDPLGLLTKLLRDVDVSGTTCLRFIDPYGDTVFNRAQSQVLARELSALRTHLQEPTATFIDTALQFANQVASDVHLYLKFEGD